MNTKVTVNVVVGGEVVDSIDLADLVEANKRMYTKDSSETVVDISIGDLTDELNAIVHTVVYDEEINQ